MLNNMSIIPDFMKLREQQRSQREEKAEGVVRGGLEGVCGGQRRGIVCCALLSYLLVLL